MTLGEFSIAVGCTPRWALNALAVLRLRRRYTVRLARRLALTRLLHEACDMPLAAAFERAGGALRGWPVYRNWEEASPDGAVSLCVDLERFLSTFMTRLSLSRTLYAPRRRGRPSRKRLGGVQAARAHGVDVSLLERSLRRTPAERLRRLDEDVAFLRSLRVRP